MIKKFLEKDKDKRMTLEDVLQYCWNHKKCKTLLETRKKSGDVNSSEQFKAFAMTEETIKGSEDSA